MTRGQCRPVGPDLVLVGEHSLVKVDAVVVEQDTSRVLGPVGSISQPMVSMAELVGDMVADREPSLGTVLFERASPLRLHAIVHDLNRTPTWRAAWVCTALRGVAREVKSRGIRSLSMPMLGVQHGTMGTDRFFWLLRGFRRQVAGSLERLIVVVPRRGWSFPPTSHGQRVGAGTT